MNKIFKNILIVEGCTWGLYIFIWLSTMFVKFEWIHPFRVFLDIPESSSEYRGAFLMCVISAFIIKFFIIKDLNSKNNE